MLTGLLFKASAVAAVVAERCRRWLAMEATLTSPLVPQSVLVPPVVVVVAEEISALAMTTAPYLSRFKPEG